MKLLPILWQRLVAEVKTCDRCDATYQEMQRAIEKVEPHLDRGKTHGGMARRVGSSRCCSVCSTSECRTVEVEGTVAERDSYTEG